MWKPLKSIFLTAFLTEYYHGLVGQPRVQLGDTSLVGKRLQPSNLEFFGGIPFAEPPVGDLRLSPPRPKYSLSPQRSFDARNYGYTCIQPRNLIFFPQLSFADMSEDCLTLNIFRPSGVNVESSLPVMVWIYGGGFLYGTSTIYDGTPLVEQSLARGTPILFVSINYRLGPLGFPQGAEAVERGALNLGLHDQRVALEWVQKNIASFGGDPRKVTVFGESAGALSTSYHYLNGDFSTVARAAIFESGTASTIPIFDAYRSTRSWTLFAKNVSSCARAAPNDTFACLMSASKSDLIAGINATLAEGSFPFFPVLDGPGGILSDSPAKRLSHGTGARVPFMIGTVLDEGTFFVPRDSLNEEISIRNIASFTPSPLGPDVLKTGIERIVSLYPDDPSAGSPFGTGNQTFGAGPGFKRAAAIFGDLHFEAQRRFWSQTTTAPSFTYIFTDPQLIPDRALGVFHSSELAYLFGNSPASGSPKSARLSRAMLDYWISFAVSLTPNDGKGTRRPHWGMYRESEGVLELNGNGVEMIPDEYRATGIETIIGLREALSW